MSASAGDLFFCPKFTFKDRKIGKKFLVLLNTPEIDDPYIFCRTTSQQKTKHLKEYCQPEWKLFLLLANKDFFPLNTWLQLYELYAFTLEEFLELHTKKNLKWVGRLQDLTVRQIKNCVKQCKEDIKKYYLSFILKKKK